MGYLHYVNGIPVEGDILSAAVANGHIIKVQACWHKIVEERGEKRDVVDVEQSLAVAVERLAEKFENARDLRFTLARVESCYYGFQDAGKLRKTFVPAWHFTFEKGGKLYHRYINSKSNMVMNSESEIANARRKQ
jgi:hypothetical protein